MITEEQHNELTMYLSHLERLASLAPSFSIYNMPMEEARQEALFQTTMIVLITLRAD